MRHFLNCFSLIWAHSLGAQTAKPASKILYTPLTTINTATHIYTPCRGERAYPLRIFTHVRQHGQPFSLFPCAKAERLPRLVGRKVAMLRAFAVGLLEIFRSCLSLLVAMPGLIDTLLHSC